MLALPAGWGAGHGGPGYTGGGADLVVFIMLQIVSKAGFSFYNLNKLRALPDDLRQGAAYPRSSEEVGVDRNAPPVAVA